MQVQRAIIAAIEFQPGMPLVQQIVDQLTQAISTCLLYTSDAADE